MHYQMRDAALAAPMEAAIKAQAKAMPLAMMIRINNSDRMTFTLQLPAVQLNF